MTKSSSKIFSISIPLPFYFFSHFSIRDGEIFLRERFMGRERTLYKLIDLKFKILNHLPLPSNVNLII